MTNRDKIIEQNFDLIEFRVKSFIGQRPGAKFYKDDLLGEAGLALVKSAGDAVREKPDNVSAYLTSAIDHALIKAFAEAETVSVPQRVQNKRIENGKPPLDLTCETLTGDIVGLKDAALDLELLEEILHVCESDFDREVITTLAGGLSRKQVAEVLSVDPMQVTRTRKRVFAAYEKRRKAALNADA